MRDQSDDAPPFLQHLGLDESADARAIRRAYAQRLKQIDQASDLVGFQALREAYQIALAWADFQQHQQQADALSTPESMLGSTPESTPKPATEVVEQATAAIDGLAPARSLFNPVAPREMPTTPQVTPLPDSSSRLDESQYSEPVAPAAPLPVQPAELQPVQLTAPQPVAAIEPQLVEPIATPAPRQAARPATPRPPTAAPEPTPLRPAVATLNDDPIDPASAAEDVYRAFRQRWVATENGTAADAIRACFGQLQRALQDPRLVSIDARDNFEYGIATLLASGWKPQHEVLFPAASAIFDWDTDRRRVLRLGQAGAQIDAAINEQRDFDAQPATVRNPQRKLLALVRHTEAPSTRQVLRAMPTINQLAARYPNWIGMVCSSEQLTRWRLCDAAVPGWRRKLSSLRWHRGQTASRTQGGRTINWRWLTFVLILALARCVNQFATDSGSPGVSQSSKPAISTPGSGSSRPSNTLGSLLVETENALWRDDLTTALREADLAVQRDDGAATAWAMRGRVRYRLGEDNRASEDFAAALQRDSHNVMALLGRGRLEADADRVDLALADYSKVLQIAPDEAQARLGRAQLYRALGKLDDAFADAAQIHDDNYLSAATELRVGIDLLRHDVAKAATDIEAMVQVDQTNAYRQAVAAGLYGRLGRTKDANTALGIATALDKSETPYLVRAARRADDDVIGRRMDYDAALARNALSVKALRARAKLEMRTGAATAAIADLDAALAVSGSRGELLTVRGTAYVKMGDIEHAGADFKAARIDVHTPTMMNNLCWAMATANIDLQDALAICDGALQIAPGRLATLDSRAMVLLRQQQWRAAIDQYDEVLAHPPGFAGARYGRGIALRRVGEVKRGDADLAEAGRMDPTIAQRFQEFGIAP